MSSHPMLQCNHSIELTLSSSLKLESSSSGEEVDRDGRGPKCLLLAGQAMSLAKLFLLLSQPPQRQSIMEYQGGGNMEYCRGTWEPERDTGAILVWNRTQPSHPTSKRKSLQMQTQPTS